MSNLLLSFALVTIGIAIGAGFNEYFRVRPLAKLYEDLRKLAMKQAEVQIKLLARAMSVRTTGRPVLSPYQFRK